MRNKVIEVTFRLRRPFGGFHHPIGPFSCRLRLVHILLVDSAKVHAQEQSHGNTQDQKTHACQNNTRQVDSVNVGNGHYYQPTLLSDDGYFVFIDHELLVGLKCSTQFPQRNFWKRSQGGYFGIAGSFYPGGSKKLIL